MRNAVRAEEERLAEIRRLEAENRAAEARRKQQDHARTQQKLSMMGLCPVMWNSTTIAGMMEAILIGRGTILTSRTGPKTQG